MLRALLTKWGYDVVPARDGLEALRILESAIPPRLAILDWIDARMDGVELCRRVRASGRELTSTSCYDRAHRVADLVEGMDAGADDYIHQALQRP